jgi:hypothetical protein
MNRARGPDSGHWKGGRSLTTQGYVNVTNHYEHPRAYKGRLLEHILIYEQHNHCCLLRWANIHHKNGIKIDNRPENLEAMMIGQHTRMHASTIPSNRSCNNCHSNTTQTDRHGGPSWFHNRDTGIGFWCQKCYMKLYWWPNNPIYKKQWRARRKDGQA